MKLERRRIADFASRLAAAEEGSAEWEEIHSQFLRYIEPFSRQLAESYHGFLPTAEGEISYYTGHPLHWHEKIRYIYDPESGFQRRVEEE
ncbi:MAG: hypothetical protein ACE5NP_11115 [Anaerolineae bacterium]